MLPKPESNVLEWYQNIQQKYGLTPYVKIDSPNSFVTQVRYQTAGTEILLFINSDAQTAHPIKIAVNKALYAGKQAWIWEADTGNRYKLDSHNGMIELNLGPADSRLVVFDQHENGSPWLPNAVAGTQTVTPANWTMEFKHIDGTIKRAALVELKDLKDLPDFVNMAGHAVYRTQFNVTDAGKVKYVNLGQVYGLSEVSINGVSMGTKWYGRRIYPVKEALKTGLNTIEIKVTTSMGNYMKTLVDNPIAQKMDQQSAAAATGTIDGFGWARYTLLTDKNSIMKLIKYFLITCLCLQSPQIFAKDYLATLFGIHSDGIGMNTKTIQFAIDYISKNGGGRLVFHVGRYLTGSIYLKSNVTIQLEEGAILLGSLNPFDYDQHELTALIFAIDQQNIGITGKGMIDGQGKAVARNVIDMIDKGLIKDKFRSGRPEVETRA